MNVVFSDPRIGSAPGWPLVLYFHHVRPDATHYTALSPDNFRRALELVLTGFGPALEPADISPDFAPPDHPFVLITFDDGYLNNLTTAAPILAEFDVRMVLFCITGELDRSSALGQPETDFLSWSQALELRALGHVLGAHSLTHPRLTELATDTVRAEVVGSLDAVAVQTAVPTTAFAYPYGLVPQTSVLDANVLAYGTVKAAPVPWDIAPHRIRRTYLPAHEPESWSILIRGWRRQWHASR
ncbi:polysaccharide deacetylase family protein [Nocardia wallacei]|uniref:polysaccharide deacetylase family protein n=1 Tax=Nocardia wallacei TaxID=480035 RepID=UPI0024542467|nr:polysaccharide deacetylase family protein [Nocardia wallacei]